MASHNRNNHTILQVVMIGDGQVSVGSVSVKPNVRKVRRIGEGVVAGFAGGRVWCAVRD